MSVKALRCPVCGAPVSREKDICDHCNTHYVIENEKAVLLGDYRGCNVYKELIKKYPNPEEEEYIDEFYFDYCKHCHIKSCPFFGKRELSITELQRRARELKRLERSIRGSEEKE